MFRRSKLVAPAVTLLAVLAGPAAAMAHSGGALYTQTNDPAGNVVQRFDRAADGRLARRGTLPTGGSGSRALGGRQGAVELSDDGRTVYAVNAGSNSVTTFRVGSGGLERRRDRAVRRRRPDERRRARRPRLRAQLRRDAERHRVRRRPPRLPDRDRRARPPRRARRRAGSVSPDGRSSWSASGCRTGSRRSPIDVSAASARR